MRANAVRGSRPASSSWPFGHGTEGEAARQWPANASRPDSRPSWIECDAGAAVQSPSEPPPASGAVDRLQRLLDGGLERIGGLLGLRLSVTSPQPGDGLLDDVLQLRLERRRGVL